MTEKEIRMMAITCENYHSCALCPYNPEDISRFIGERWKGGCPDYDRKIVYAMGKGYRKIPKGAVVLTNKEKNSLWCEAWNKAVEQTAREILDLLYSQMPKTQIVVEIEKRYGVKITDIGGNENDRGRDG